MLWLLWGVYRGQYTVAVVNFFNEDFFNYIWVHFMFNASMTVYFGDVFGSK